MRHIRTLTGIIALLGLAASAVADAPIRAAADTPVAICSATGEACPAPCGPHCQSCPMPCSGMESAQICRDAEPASR